MNWELRNGHKDTVEDFLAGKFTEILVEGIEKFAPQLGTLMDLYACDGTNLGPDAHGPQENYAEYPDGYFHEGASYRYRFNVRFYRGDKFISLNPTRIHVESNRTGRARKVASTVSAEEGELDGFNYFTRVVS
jgi:hypothetical protein